MLTNNIIDIIDNIMKYNNIMIHNITTDNNIIYIWSNLLYNANIIYNSLFAITEKCLKIHHTGWQKSSLGHLNKKQKQNKNKETNKQTKQKKRQAWMA